MAFYICFGYQPNTPFVAELVPAWVVAVMAGAYMIFWPMHYEGLAGMPRRYFDFSIWESFKQFAELNKFITITCIHINFLKFCFKYFFISIH